MSVKAIITRAMTSILLATLFWTASMAKNIKSTHVQPIMPKCSNAKQNRVMSVNEMCLLLNAKLFDTKKAGPSLGTIVLDYIQISMDEICTKEKSFENKAVPATEIVGEGKNFRVLYRGITIRNTPKSHTNTIITSKHIRALSKFLHMFAGRRIERLFIHNIKLTQDEQELLRIRKTLNTTPRLCVPISMKYLLFSSTEEAKSTHPALLQAVLQAVGNADAASEQEMYIDLQTTVDHIKQTIQLLGGLRRKKVESIKIKIEAEKQTVPELNPEVATALMDTGSIQAFQEWKYNVEKLHVFSSYGNSGVTLPAWLLRKPTLRLVLDMPLYMSLSWKEVRSIRTKTLRLLVWGDIDQQSIEKDTTKKKGEEVTNTKITELHISHMEDSYKQLLTKEETLAYAKCYLTWAVTQFPSLTTITIGGVSKFCSDMSGLAQAVSEMAKKFASIVMKIQ